MGLYIHADPVNFVFVWVPVTGICWGRSNNIEVDSLILYKAFMLRTGCKIPSPLSPINSLRKSYPEV